MINRSFAGIAVLGLLVMSASADAAVITYTNRVLWTAAAGGVSGGENFNGFVADTEFRTAPLALAAGMSIGVMVNDGLDNIIDVVPVDAEVNVNGTPVAHMWTGFIAARTTPFVSFGTPVYAFGADFMNLNDGDRTRIELYNGAVLVDTLTPSVTAFGVVRFFGFVSDTAITQIRFVGPQADVFGMDDIEIQTRAVPEPVSLLLFSVGLGAGAVRLRRKA